MGSCQASFSSSQASAGVEWCGRGDLNPHRHLCPTDFHTTSAFAAAVGVRGLDYPFTVALAVGAARLVSTPSPEGAWLGIAT
jgi:hypothetical protein